MATRVTVSLGYTRNMGNFESLRVDIGIADDLRAGEEIDKGFDRVYGYVEKKLIEKVQETEEELNQKGE